MGAPRIVSARISVIFRSEGLEFVFVFCGSASSISSAQNPSPSAPAAPFKNDRRGCVPFSYAMVTKFLSAAVIVYTRPSPNATATRYFSAVSALSGFQCLLCVFLCVLSASALNSIPRTLSTLESLTVVPLRGGDRQEDLPFE